MSVTVELAYTQVLSYRLMERDNKKARDDARKEYNDTIRVCCSLSLTLVDSDVRTVARDLSP